MSALAMAILLNGMAPDELARWTEAMIASGERLDLSAVRRPTTDKHSTGGVGDKITLPLAPLVAALGAAVPQLSGRGLGHTGGTLDKLESIPGWRANLSNAEFLAQLDSVGAVICAAGDELAPADRKLYALRDVTGTVEAIPLIASSIMSKKIAEGSAALVLDVKVGTGAFMKTREDARAAGRDDGGAGHRGRHPHRRPAHRHEHAARADRRQRPGGGARPSRCWPAAGPPDVVELTVALAVEMLAGAGITGVDPAEALADGRAMDVWRAMIAAQGGDPDADLPVAAEKQVLTAPATGVLTRLDAYAVGVAAWRLGAGRARKEDPVSAGAGVVLLAKPGEQVRAGQPLLELHTDEPARFERALQALDGGFDIGERGRLRRGAAGDRACHRLSRPMISMIPQDARRLTVPAARLPKWLDGFADRHGGLQTRLLPDPAAPEQVVISAADGSPGLDRGAVPALAAGRVPTADLAAAAPEPARAGSACCWCAGVATRPGCSTAPELVSSKVGSAYVQGSTKAGGWSQQRFARRRANQARQAFAEAAEVAVRILLPEAGRLVALVCGGDRAAVDAALSDPRLAPLLPLRTREFLAVPDPRLKVLQATPEQFLAVRLAIHP